MIRNKWQLWNKTRTERKIEVPGSDTSSKSSNLQVNQLQNTFIFQTPKTPLTWKASFIYPKLLHPITVRKTQ